MSSEQRLNNFDLIRLLAAAQVVLAHGFDRTGLHQTLPPAGVAAFEALLMLPGVPIFFVISGFLITQSFERNPADLKGYLWRRALRIFPALWVCLAATLAVLGIFGFLQPDFVFSKTFAAWFAGQVSFFQFYNPEHFRNFGVGVANGALWTITVELQFYVFVPIFHLLATKLRANPRISQMFSGLLFLTSFAAYCTMDHHLNGPGGYTGAPIAYKLLFVTLIPHLWMFMLGIHLQRNFERLKPWIEGKFPAYAAAYVIFMAVQHTVLPERNTAFYLAYLPARILLAAATISLAFSARSLSSRLLRGRDLSYGTYLFHSVVINVFVELDLTQSHFIVIPILLVSLGIAMLSWHFVEKPALALKSLRPSYLRNPVRCQT